MHILFIVDDFNGGAGNVVQILGNQFAKEGHNVTIMLFDKINDMRYSFNSNVNIVNFKLANIVSTNKLLWLFKTIILIRKKINSLNPDAVISFIDNNNALTGISLIGSKIPFIASERSDPLRIHPDLIWRVLRAIAYFRANAVTVQCSNFVTFCNSRYIKKTVVMPNPILVPKVKKNIIAKDKDVIEIVTLGRLNKIKGYDLLISAFAMVYKKHPNTKLSIIGEGSEREFLESIVKKCKLEDAVNLPGHKSDIYSILADSDIYVMSSRHEGFPNALSEAMAVGLPVVAFECHSGIRDLINQGENGILVNQGDVDALADTMCKMIEDKELRLRLATNASKIVHQYNIEKVYLMWKDCIKKFSDIGI